MKKIFRQGARDDADGIFDVVSTAFKLPPSDSKWEIRRREAFEHPELFRVLELGGRVVSVVRILRQRVAVGGSFVIKGDVGQVSTHPDFQGRGLMTELMNDCVEWMRAEGFDISRLGGLVHFYSRFGYEPFPRRYIEFPLTPARAAGRTQSPAELLAPLDPSPGTVRPFDPVKDGEQKAELARRFSLGRTGAPVSDGNPHPRRGAKPADNPPPDVHPLRFVYERDGEVRGYLFAAEHHEEANETQAKFHISDAAFDPLEPGAAPALINHLLHIVLERGGTRVTSRLPFDPVLCERIQKGGVKLRLVELCAAFASNMMRIINLESMFKRILPELESRLSSSPARSMRHRITLHVAGESVQLDAAGGRVSVSRAAEGAGVTLTQVEMLKLLLGIASAHELSFSRAGALSPEDVGLLAALFPRQATASGMWG